MASPKAALLLLAAALLVSCCYASRSAAVLATGGETKEEEKAVIQSTDPAKCVWMRPCIPDKCNEYCVTHKLGMKEGFCSFYNTDFVCCCPDSPPAKIPISSSAKQV